MSVTRRAGVALIASACVLAVCTVSGQSATADTKPPSGTPNTVSADVLPTWQINGVVKFQVIVNNIVYATGRFTKARPPGVAAGGAGERAAKNIFAYDIRTGKRVAAFNHSLNAQGLSISRSPDGKRVYVGGDFTKVDGHVHNHIAAFDTKTKKLVSSFRASADRHVQAIAVSPTRVYFGGPFLHANGQARNRLAAVGPGGRLSPWKATANDHTVRAMVVSPDRSRLIVGGSFTKLNGQAATGMGSLSVSKGAVMPWAANQTIQDSSSNGAIISLRKDGSQIYGSGYSFGSGANFEGTFAANPTTGHLNWVNDCHGDTYDVLPLKKVLYSVGHAHDCSVIGEFPETSPVTTHHALASWTTPHGGTNSADSRGGAWNNYIGKPVAQHLQWFPALTPGSFTGQNQAAWSLVGNTRYIALGGEFPTADGHAQQGLVRYAMPSIAPNKRGSTRDFGLSGSSPAPGQAHLSWTSVWDPDNNALTYRVYRKQSGRWVQLGSAIHGNSTFWQRPNLTYDDKDGVQGGQKTYHVTSTDPYGNTRTSDSVTVSVLGTGG
jgi:hypothetical protein